MRFLTDGCFLLLLLLLFLCGKPAKFQTTSSSSSLEGDWESPGSSLKLGANPGPQEMAAAEFSPLSSAVKSQSVQSTDDYELAEIDPAPTAKLNLGPPPAQKPSAATDPSGKRKSVNRFGRYTNFKLGLTPKRMLIGLIK